MAVPPQEVYGDRYIPVRLVARGGMAEVWLAHDELLDRMVALKVLFPELSIDRNFVERFRREAQAAASLSHPSIVSVYDWGEADDTYFIVMEYVDGRPLSALLRTEGPLLADRAAGIGADAAGALGFAHRSGVIHRDVKPGNVLITVDDLVKVTDFGIARAIGTDDHLTQTGAVMGTATYFSPEQAQGMAVDQRSDVYSLGVVLYEMVAGRPPFVADGPVAVAYKHVHEDPPPPTAVVPEIPLAFEAVVLQALAKDVTDRYASAEELRADLLRFRQGRVVLAEPPPPGRRGRAPAARSPRARETAVGFHAPVTEVARSGGVPAAGAALAAAAVAGGLTAEAVEAAGAGAAGAPAAAPAADGAAAAAGAEASGAGPDAAGLADLERTVRNRHGTDAPPAGPATTPGGNGARGRGAMATADLPPVSPTNLADEPEPSLARYVVLLAILLTALGVMVFLLNRQLDLFGTATHESARPPATAPVPVPADLIGKSYTDALNQAQNLGLTVVRVDVQDARHPANSVVATRPTAGQQVQPGATLELDVSDGPAPITEPDVVGEDAQSAAQQLQQAGFAVAPQQVQSSGTVAAGQVVSTNPPPGYQGHAGDTVTLVVSSGPGKVPVPDVAGKDVTTADNLLTQAGFRVGRGRQQSSVSVPAGSVVGTNPAAGTPLLQGSVVYVEVSSGPAQVRVPYVLNYTEANAKADIEARGLVVAETSRTVSDPSKDGIVLSQDPGAGVTVDQGSTVTIVIGQYPGSTPTTA